MLQKKPNNARKFSLLILGKLLQISVHADLVSLDLFYPPYSRDINPLVYLWMNPKLNFLLLLKLHIAARPVWTSTPILNLTKM